MRYDHHPDPAIAYEIEVQIIEGLAYNASVGLDDPKVVQERIDRAMQFRVGGDQGAVAAKQRLRSLRSDKGASHD